MRPIKHRTEWGDRPERTEGGGLRHYDEKEAIRYSSTPQTIVIQTELASRALSLLQLPKGHLLLNIGCGSGLCGAVLTRHHHAWVGTDISLPMLHLAQRNPACSGRVVASDMTQGLPFCPGIFDAAVSISAVQWICVGPRPRIAAALFFRDLYRCLKHGAKAVLQVYIEHDEQTTLLLDAAHQAGFDEVGYYVDHPHPTAAKKFFICAIKGGSFCRNSHLRSETRSATSTLVHTASLYEEWGHDRKCCPLAWPARGSCLLRWISHSTSSAWPLSSQEQACSRCSTDALQTSNTAINGVVERLQREHSLLGRRALRLLRHATGGGPLPLGLMQSTHSSLHNNKSSENNNSSNDMGERGGENNNRRDCNCDDSALRIEGSAVASNGLMHCGGCTTVHMRLAADWISSSSAHAHAPGVFASSSGKVEPVDFSSLLIERLLRLCSEESMVRVWDCSTSLFTPHPDTRQKNRDDDDDDGVAAADGDQSAGGTAKPPVDNTWTAWIASAAIDDSATSQRRFFWLESIPGRTDAAILHANKLPPFFVLCRDYSPRPLKAAGQGRQKQNQPERLKNIKDLFQNTLHKDFVGIQSLCNALGGCCVGMDVTIVDGEGSLACAWLLYVHGLQETRREEVARWMNDIVD